MALKRIFSEIFPKFAKRWADEVFNLIHNIKIVHTSTKYTNKVVFKQSLHVWVLDMQEQ